MPKRLCTHWSIISSCGRSLTGSQIVSAEWVKASTKPRSAHLRPGRYIEDGEPNLGYGYQWWIPEGKEGEFLAIGVYGQFIYVNPLSVW